MPNLRTQAYRDRTEAGEILGEHVRHELGASADAVVLALPRGGVPVGFAVARVLGAVLDVFLVRKLGVPGHEELAMGAIATGGFQVLNERLIAEAGVTENEIAAVTEREAAELLRREAFYRADRPRVTLTDRLVLLVDDGLATGFSMRAAIAAVRERGPRRIVVAVPVGAADTCAEIEREIGTVICPLQPDPFHAVGLWYYDFTQTTDDEVRECLAAAARNTELAHRRDGS
jgi:putative phosphoribosyl transferase